MEYLCESPAGNHNGLDWSAVLKSFVAAFCVNSPAELFSMRRFPDVFRQEPENGAEQILIVLRYRPPKMDFKLFLLIFAVFFFGKKLPLCDRFCQLGF